MEGLAAMDFAVIGGAIDQAIEWSLLRASTGWFQKLPGWMLRKPLSWLLTHWRSFLKFGFIGGSVFFAGVGMLYLLVSVWHLNSVLAYAIQAVFSVELSYVLNYHWTWKERKPEKPAERRRYFFRSLRRWNLKKVGTATVNQIIFTFMITALHMNYMVANVVTTVIFTAINYVLGDKWTFAVPKDGQAGAFARFFNTAMRLLRIRKGRHERTGEEVVKPQPNG